MDPKHKQQTVGQMWMGVFAALVVIAGVAFALWEIGPENEPPPVNDLRVIDAGLDDPGCVLRVNEPGGTVAVHRRPGDREMIVADLPHDTELDIVHVRASWVEIRGPIAAGYVNRRFTVRECE